MEGIALSPLRPAGIGEIEGERLDVVSDGDFIDKESPIIVTKIDGYRLVVREKPIKGKNKKK
jgi:membrane-bound serine protease (ClpP class)